MAALRVEPLSTREKLCYAVGEFSGTMMYNVMSLYANIFLLEVVKILIFKAKQISTFTPLVATAVVFGSRVWDVLAYPLLIPVLNASKPNTWGKYKTWMIASTMIMIPSNILAWYVPDIGNGGRIAWYLVFHSVFLVLQTETGYLVSAGTISAITILAVSTTVFSVKEYAGSTVPGSDTSRGTLLKDIWEVCTFRPFADLVGLGMLSAFGVVLPQWSAALAVQYALRLEDQLENLLLAFLGATVVSIPISALLMTRFEKKLVFAGFSLIGISACVSLMYVPARRLDLAAIVLCLLGAGFSAPLFIPWTMLTDVADDFKIQKGKRRDMLFQTLFQCLNSTSMLFASVTSLVALEIGGYQTGACTQPDSVAFTTRLLVSFIPAGVILLSLVFLWRYQLTGERLQANKAVLEERRNQQATDNANGNTGGTAPQQSLEMKSHDLPDKRGPVQLTYFGPYGSFRFKRP
ncbi:sodium-dependent lysophosphatidylcholine symporter 1-like [Branchiostoma lanceolatum]|uniref:sodium-dependent lysophosphatidylcholine symporter 1-like n=1 Tax=Branchiostoma lanceolatum TaxID=7740 RepID=UPI00345462C2